LAAGTNVELLSSQILEFKPKTVVVATQSALDQITDRLANAGLVRRHWRGFDGGEEAAAAIDVFFDRMRERSAAHVAT
jgi:1-deoxy-D-xylulose 5-phosphate reductoisomerase